LFHKPPKKLTTVVLRALSMFGLTEITSHPTTGNILEATNLTILNFLLLRLGPMNEKRLVRVLMCVQVSVLCVSVTNRAGINFHPRCRVSRRFIV
jgi:UDP-N-acetylglucosamine--dolichyl-phosphate N-acetylglucosaminephosphotransferase